MFEQYVDPRFPHIDPKYHSELKPQLMAIGSLNSWIRSISASRQQMNASQMGQNLTTRGATNKHFFTGMEFEYSRFTHHVKVHEDSKVYDIINKYSGSVGGRQLESPLTTMILVTRGDVVDVVEIPKHYCNHEYFGFEYKRKPIMDTLSSGSGILAGTILADTPVVDSQGNYAYSIELPMAFTSGKGGIEDGITIAEEVLDDLIVKAYGWRSASWGKDLLPLNTYGNDKKYYVCPDIGQEIGQSGLVFARRVWNVETAPMNLTRRALQNPTQFDKLTYGEPGARVIDIQITKGRDSKNLAPEWEEQCNYYWTKSLQYYRRIVEADQVFTKKYGKNYKHTPRWNQMVIYAMAFIAADDPKSKVQLANGRAVVDDWEVKVIYEYDYRPNYGSKLTDHHGGKGVITSIKPKAQMYKDADGHHCLIEMDAASKVNRMNYGGVHEQLANASRWATELRLKKMWEKGCSVDEAFDYIMGFYKMYAPLNHMVMSEPHIDKRQHIEHVLKHDIYAMLPTDNPVDYSEIAANIMNTPYAPCRGVCTYEDADGNIHTTTNRIMIGPVPMLLLERAGNTFSAVSSPKLQHFAAPAKQSKADRHSSHSKQQPTRFGESESRNQNHACSGILGQEMNDRANNPRSHDKELHSIFYADTPSDIDNAVPRDEVDLTGGCIKELQEQIYLCTGTILVDCEEEYEQE